MVVSIYFDSKSNLASNLLKLQIVQNTWQILDNLVPDY